MDEERLGYLERLAKALGRASEPLADAIPELTAEVRRLKARAKEIADERDLYMEENARNCQRLAVYLDSLIPGRRGVEEMGRDELESVTNMQSARIAELETRISSQAAHITAIEAARRNEGVDARRAGVYDQVNQLKRDLEAAQGGCSKRDRRIAELEAELRDMTDRYHAASGEADRLHDQINHAGAYRDAMDGKL